MASRQESPIGRPQHQPQEQVSQPQNVQTFLKKDPPAKQAKKLYLTKQEDKDLSQWLELMIEKGFNMREKHLLDEVQLILEQVGRENDFVDNRPDSAWLNDVFYKLHPTLRKKLNEKVLIFLRGCSSRVWFDNLSTFLKMNNLYCVNKDRKRCWVMDKIEFNFHQTSGQYTSDSVTNATHTTSLYTSFSAEGITGPRILSFNKNDPFLPFYEINFPSGWIYSLSKEEDIPNEGEILKMYFIKFHEYLQYRKIELPVLVYINGQKFSCITMEISKYCDQHGIILYPMYLNSTHFRETVRGDTIHVIRDVLQQFTHQRTKYEFTPVTKLDFPEILQQILNNLDEKTIRATFRHNGFYPFSPKKVSRNIPGNAHHLITTGPPKIIEPVMPGISERGFHLAVKKMRLTAANSHKKIATKNKVKTHSPSDSTLELLPIAVATQNKVKTHSPSASTLELLPIAVENEELQQFETDGVPHPHTEICAYKMEVADEDLHDLVQSIEDVSETIPNDSPTENLDINHEIRHLCRTCGGQNSNMIPIFCEESREVNLVEKIKHFLNIEVDENGVEFPLHMCSECVTKLKFCQHFADTAESVDKNFKMIVAQQKQTREAMENMETEFVCCEVDGNEEMCSSETILPDLPAINENSHEISNEAICQQAIDVLQIRRRKSKKKNLACQLCNNEFSNAENLQFHQKHFHKVLNCDECSLCFYSQEKLMEHRKEHYITCKFCNKTLKLCNFQSHVDTDHKDLLPKYLDMKQEYVKVQCKLCDVIHSSRRSAKKHYFNIHLKQSCEICLEVFETVSELDTHTNDVHLLPCSHCSESFFTIRRFKRHVNKYHKEFAMEPLDFTDKFKGNYECLSCKKGITTKLLLKRHNYWTHYKYTCLICYQTFTTPELEEDHYKIHGNTCLICNDNKFITPGLLAIHMKLAHDNVKPYVCENCGDSFDLNDKLKSHRKEHERSTVHLCEVCGKEYKRADSLAVHHKINHSPKTGSLKLTCDICDKKFLFLSNLKLHMATHTGIKSFTCKHCPRQFTTMYSLKQHLEKHKILLDCKLCKLKFNYKYTLKSHVKAIHDTPDMIYKCLICDKCCLNKHNISIHLTSHSLKQTDVGNYSVFPGLKCEYCDNIFSQKTLLMRHMKKHLRNKHKLIMKKRKTLD